MKLFNILKKIWTLSFRKYKISNEELNFIEKNKIYWKSNNNKIGIIIEGFLESPTSVIEKARIAKAIEEKLNITSVVLLRGFSKKSSGVFEIYKSFSIKNFIMWWSQYLNPYLLIKIFFKTMNIYRKYPTGEKLLNLKYDGIIIGDLIYDTLIRFNPGEYTILKLNIKKHFRHIFRSLYSVELYKKIFEENDIKAVVTSHNVYAEYGILTRLAYKYNAHIYLKDMNVFKYYDGRISINEHFLKVDIINYKKALKDNTVLEKAEDYLKSRFNGSANQIDVQNAYANKKTYLKKELLDLFNINNKNKNVFILAHAFSDAPHVGEGLLFNDYYHWLVETLKISSKNNKINIFVKPHPSSYMWNEFGAVEQILETFNIKNVHVLPKDFNTNSITDIADYILTAKGTAGLEFSCFGIPAIIAGIGYYSGFDIAIESKNINEYISKLENITTIKPLSEETKRKAIILLYLSMKRLVRSEILPNNDIFPGDDFDKKFRQQYEEVTEKLSQDILMKDKFYQHILEIAKDPKC